MKRRTTPLLGAILATAFFSGFMVGSPIVSLVIVGPAVALAVYVFVVRRRQAPAEAAWSVADPLPLAPVQPGTARQVSAALGRVESRELALSVWFGIGLGFLVVIFLAFAVAYPDDNGEVWMEHVGYWPWFVHPLAGLTIVAVYRAVTRPARDDTAELFESCPTEPSVRLLGIMRSAVVPVVAYLVFLLLYSAAIAVRSPAIHGPVSANAAAFLLASLVLLVGAVFFGTALGSWIRFGLAPIVGVVAVGFLSIGLASAGDPGWNGLSGLSTFGPQADSALILPFLPAWWYLAWMIALTLIVGVIAVLRYRRDRGVWVTGGSLSLLRWSPGSSRRFRSTPPMPNSLPGSSGSRRTTRRAKRRRVHGSRSARTRAMENCVARWPLPSAPSATPSPTKGTLTVRTVDDAEEQNLPTEVRRLLPDGFPEPNVDEVFVGFNANDSALLADRLLVAFTALGLPLYGSVDMPMVLSGEARGVVAQWLASRGLPRDEALDLATGDPGGDDAFDRGNAWPDMCGPVVWSEQDLDAAQALIRLPEAEVATVVVSGRDRWSDPATGTDELLAELGLASAGPYDEFETRVDDFC
ncbi:MAG: hypothetical protein M5U31_00395 [Acidimicrobiia bacterium]|nr:hypothetical protein [Acidimicrobiia bacterium]